MKLETGSYLYGGKHRNDEKGKPSISKHPFLISLAMKSACNELKGCTCLFHANDGSLKFPLMALIHYRGYCLLAICIVLNLFFPWLNLNQLPLDNKEGKTSILYGSDDGGKSVHADDPNLNEIMKGLCKKANLAAHSVLGKLIYGPGDIESMLSSLWNLPHQLQYTKEKTHCITS